MVLNDIEKDSTIRFQPARRMSDEEFYAFCAANPGFRIERTAKGEIVIMPPTGGETSHRNRRFDGSIVQLGQARGPRKGH
jgi:Uma2 family endonuclease